MNNSLKTYKIILTVQSPLFIGDGRKIGKKEYIFDSLAGDVYIPNIEKMFEYLYSKNLLPKYRDYLLKDNYLDLAGRLKNWGIPPKEYMKFVSYKMSCGDVFEIMKNRKEIFTFIKDAYGYPYIPGSSLKGAIRTTMLADITIRNRDKYRDLTDRVMSGDLSLSRNKLLSNEIKEIEQRRFYTLNRADKDGKPVNKSNAVNDVLSGLRIGDSKPLKTADLVLCQKIDESVTGNERELPLLRECLKPGTTVQFDLTIDTTLCSFDKDDIMRAINGFTQYNAKYFDSSFRKLTALPKDALFLGGGAGYQTKTATYALTGKSPQTVEQVGKIIDSTLGKDKNGNKKNEHGKDRALGVSPHTIKRTCYRGKKYPMGICTVKIV